MEREAWWRAQSPWRRGGARFGALLRRCGEVSFIKKRLRGEWMSR
jgi:hypothetical protein